MGQMKDKDLVNKILDGDHMASKVLIDQYQKLVFHVVARLVDNQEDREELCQDVFVKVFKNLAGFQFQSKLSTWIATIAYRLSINFLQKSKRRNLEQNLDHVSFNLGVTDGSVEDLDYALFIQQLIQQMPDTYKTVLTLFHIEGFSYPEIMKVTGMPEGTVKNYLFRARKKLKELSEPYVGKEIHFI